MPDIDWKSIAHRGLIDSAQNYKLMCFPPPLYINTH